jgi:hypothetical protein
VIPGIKSKAALALALAVLPLAGLAQEFSAVITPPRFEDRARPGTTYRNVIEINNTASRQARYTVQTADWTLDATGAPLFDPALRPASCRPWVGLEAREVVVPSGAKRRFRFEVAVPAEAPRGECTFAIMIEGEPQPARGNVPLPVSGRIGVIVYLAIGDAAPALELVKAGVQPVQGQALPFLQVRNTGDMHARLDGFLAGLDAKGTRIVLVPDNSPILVGMTRDLPLYPQAEQEGTAPPAIAYPLRIKGRLDSDRQRLEIDTTVAQ